MGRLWILCTCDHADTVSTSTSYSDQLFNYSIYNMVDIDVFSDSVMQLFLVLSVSFATTAAYKTKKVLKANFVNYYWGQLSM